METFQLNFEKGINKETYFNICEQLGDTPNPDKMPPDIEDFPPDVQKAIVVFNKLGDRRYPEIGYVGKDYTSLPIYMEVYEVDNRKIFLETLLRLDSKLIEANNAQLKAEYDKIRARNNKPR